MPVFGPIIKGVLGGEALAEVLFGHTAPSARLPVMVTLQLFGTALVGLVVLYIYMGFCCIVYYCVCGQIPTNESQLPVDYLDQSMQAAPGRTHRYFSGTP